MRKLITLTTLATLLIGCTEPQNSVHHKNGSEAKSESVAVADAQPAPESVVVPASTVQSTESDLYRTVNTLDFKDDIQGYISSVKNAIPGADPETKRFVVATLIEQALQGSPAPTLKAGQEESTCVKLNETSGLDLNCTNPTSCEISKKVEGFDLCVTKTTTQSNQTKTLSAIETICSDLDDCLGNIAVPAR